MEIQHIMRNKKTERGGEELTATKIRIPPVSNTPLLPPEFCRLPRPKTRCPITGLSRTSLIELVDEGKVRAVRLRKKGAARGVTLINRQSLLDYLHGLEQVTKE
jgi:hypothetical protein